MKNWILFQSAGDDENNSVSSQYHNIIKNRGISVSYRNNYNLNNTEKKIDNTNRLNELNSKENKILKETDGKHTLLLKKAENNSEFNKQNIIEIDKSINKEEIQNKRKVKNIINDYDKLHIIKNITK